jgi:Fur family transcriptional regulator, ferric uptake regulator
MTAAPHDVVDSRLRASGQRYTDQRRELVALLARTGPLSIPEVLRGRRGLKQSSVYRNLAVLAQAGVVRRVLTDEDHGRYELTEELTRHHHHLICSSCGRVEDVTVPGDVEGSLERTLDRLARRAGFADVDHRLDLIGTCSDCA